MAFKGWVSSIDNLIGKSNFTLIETKTVNITYTTRATDNLWTYTANKPVFITATANNYYYDDDNISSSAGSYNGVYVQKHATILPRFIVDNSLIYKFPFNSVAYTDSFRSIIVNGETINFTMTTNQKVVFRGMPTPVGRTGVFTIRIYSI